MRKLVSVFVLTVLCMMHACWEVSPAFADTNLGPGGTYRTIARNLSWASANQTWLLQPIGPNTSACLTFQNLNPTSSHTFALAVFQAADLTLTSYTGNQALFTPSVVNGKPSPIAAATSIDVSVSLSGAAQFAIVISSASSATGSPDTLNIFVTQGAPCTAPTSWTIVSGPAAGSAASVSIAGVTGVRHIMQSMSFSWVQTASTAQNDFVVVRDGACGSGAVIYEFRVALPATAGTNDTFGLSGLAIIGTAGNAMCIEFSSGHASTFETVAAGGIDTE